MDHILAIVPSILALLLFIFVMRLIINGDRMEREAEEKFDRENHESERMSQLSQPGTKHPGEHDEHMER